MKNEKKHTSGNTLESCEMSLVCSNELARLAFRFFMIGDPGNNVKEFEKDADDCCLF